MREENNRRVQLRLLITLAKNKCMTFFVYQPIVFKIIYIDLYEIHLIRVSHFSKVEDDGLLY